MDIPTPTALIADDEPHLATHLCEALAEAWPELLLLPPARNGREAAQRIAEQDPDFAFLDIRMPGLTGLEVAQGIEGATRVVFVTAYDEYAVRAFEEAALDYLLKPVTVERLQRCVARCRAAWAAGPGASAPEGRTRPRDAEGLENPPIADGALADVLRRLLPVRSTGATPLRWIRATRGDLTLQVAVDDVLYFHADDKYTVVRTVGAEHLIRTPIQELATQLDPAQFWQIHRSTIVNLRHVLGTRRDPLSRLHVRIRDHDRELRVSRAYVHLFKGM
jgi:DNA-binding LytR/AlgR family response regulator